MNTRLLIICGNHKEFNYYQRRFFEYQRQYHVVNMYDVIYIWSPDVLRGMSRSEYICVGTYHKLRKWPEIREILRYRNFIRRQHLEIDLEFQIRFGRYLESSEPDFLTKEEMFLT